MAYPSGFKYTNDHEWIDIAGDRGTVGITDYAQAQLGDVVYVDLPEINGRELFTLIPLGVIVIILGVYPTPIIDLMTQSLQNLNEIVAHAVAVSG